jgi:uncharacterized membrane protein
MFLLFPLLVPYLVLLTLGLVIFVPGIFWVFLWPQRLRRQALQGFLGGGDDAAIEILRERYATGEITKDEFDVMMKDLQEQPQQSQ